MNQSDSSEEKAGAVCELFLIHKKNNILQNETDHFQYFRRWMDVFLHL